MLKLQPIILILALGLAHPLRGQIGSAGIGGFGGPSVLGRGAANAAGRSPELGMRFYAGVNGNYDTGLTGFALDANGNVQNAASVGAEGVAGIYGTKRNRRSVFSLNYQGSYRHYTNIRNFNGTDQNVSLLVSRQLNSRSTFGMGVSAGTTNRAFGINSISGFVDPNFIGFGAPAAEIFDNRIYYGSGSANYIWQRTARSSVSLIGSGFITRRTGRVLFGANGANTGADYAYRVTRNQSISVGYNYLFFNFTRNFGDTHGHGVYVGYAARIARKYNLALRLGGLRIENLFVRSVEVDPVIAAIVGIQSTTEVAHNRSLLPNGGISFGGPLTRRSNFDISASLGAVPGNGVIITSRNWNGGASYNYTGLRRLGFGASLFYNQMSSLIGAAQKFSSVNGNFNLTPRLTESLHLNMTVGTRRFLEGPTNGFRRNSYFATLGLFWSPGELPLNFR